MCFGSPASHHLMILLINLIKIRLVIPLLFNTLYKRIKEERNYKSNFIRLTLCLINLEFPSPIDTLCQVWTKCSLFENNIQGGKTLMQWSLIKLFTSYHLTEYLLPLTSFILTVWKMICTVNTSYGGVTR